jgi:hypothetical protein
LSASPLIIDDYKRFAACLVDLLDVGVFVTDREQIVYYRPSSAFDLKMQIGLPVKPGMASHTAIHERRRVVMRKDSSYSGQPFITVVIPLQDEQGAVIGTLAVTEPVDRQDKLKGLARRLSGDLGALAATTAEILARTEKIAATAEDMVAANIQSQQRVTETDQVLGVIRLIAARRTCSASTPPSRRPRRRAGRGFGVVAGEIRKLAATSAESIGKIAEIIAAVKSDSKATDMAIADIRDTLPPSPPISAALPPPSGNRRPREELDTIAEELVKSASTPAPRPRSTHGYRRRRLLMDNRRDIAQPRRPLAVHAPAAGHARIGAVQALVVFCGAAVAPDALHRLVDARHDLVHPRHHDRLFRPEHHRRHPVAGRVHIHQPPVGGDRIRPVRKTSQVSCARLAASTSSGVRRSCGGKYTVLPRSSSLAAISNPISVCEPPIPTVASRGMAASSSSAATAAVLRNRASNLLSLSASTTFSALASPRSSPCIFLPAFRRFFFRQYYSRKSPPAEQMSDI